MQSRRMLLGTLGALGFAFGYGFRSMALCADDRSSDPNYKQTRVLVLLKTLDNPFFVDIQQGVESLKTGFVITVRSGQNESDIKAQREALGAFASMAAKTIAGVIITPCGSGPELIAPLTPYRKAGVPVVLVDTAIPRRFFERAGIDYSMFVGSSNQQGGELAAKKLLSLMPALPTSVLLLNGVDGSDTAAARRAGFKAAIGALPVVEKVANWRKHDARETVASLIVNGAAFDGVFAANDEMALGAVNAYKDLGRKIPPIIGFDATAEARRAVKKGDLSATIAQNPFSMGRAAIEAVRDPPAQPFLDRLLPVTMVDAQHA